MPLSPSVAFRGLARLAFLSAVLGCDQPELKLKPLQNPGWPEPPPWGVATCMEPIVRKRAFDDETALGVRAQDAFAQLEGSCTAAFKWQDMEAATEVSVRVSLDRDSVVETTHAQASCAGELGVQADITVSTADGQLEAKGRGVFRYLQRRYAELEDYGLPAKITVSAKPRDGSFVVEVGGGGAPCAGEVRWRDTGRLVGTWSANGCALGETAVAADSSPELRARIEQLAEAWRDVRLDATWDTADKTELELDVKASDAPICQSDMRLVSIPVDVRYGSADGHVPVHDARGVVQAHLSNSEASVRLQVSEPTDCSADAALPYCKGLRSAILKLAAQYPNTPGARLAYLTIDGQLAESSDNAMTREQLTIAGRPHKVDCLLTTDCAVDKICSDGFCRAPATNQTAEKCSFDSNCNLGRRCRAGVCSSL